MEESFYDFNYNGYLVCFVSTSTYPYSIHKLFPLENAFLILSSVLLL